MQRSSELNISFDGRIAGVQPQKNLEEHIIIFDMDETLVRVQNRR
jgi:hypothetical protein